MSSKKKNSKPALQNAGKIIEKFGGIRPMAAKIDTPVTTVQGWKKRDVIPGTRRADILAAAAENNISLDKIIASEGSIAANNDAPAAVKKDKLETENAETKKPDVSTDTKAPEKSLPRPNKVKVEAKAETPKSSVKSDVVIEDLSAPASNLEDEEVISVVEHDKIMSAIEENSKKLAIRTTWIVTFLLLLATAAAMFFFWPSNKKMSSLETQVETLKTEVKDVNKNAKILKNIVPENMKVQMDDLQNQARNIQTAVEQMTDEAKEVSRVALGEEGADLSNRISALENKIKDFNGLEKINNRIKSLEGSLSGREQIEKSVDEIREVKEEQPGDENYFKQKLKQAQEAKTALGKSLGGVSKSDMKAAAMLLTLSQMRSSLDREQPFSEDLELIKKFAGDDNVELQEAISRLAPYANGGILSFGGLADEFKGLAGDAVASSLSGDDISLKDKAKARLNNVIQLEKNGELVSGTQTQAVIHRTEKLLDEGQVEQAIVELKTLDGDAAEAVKPFVERAEVTLLAKRVQELAEQDIATNNTLSDAVTSADSLEKTQEDMRINMDDVERILQETQPQAQSEAPSNSQTGLPGDQSFKGFSARQSE